jgi:IS5 family transposase
MSGKSFESVLVDKGYRGRKQIGETKVVIPGKIRQSLSAHYQRKQRKRYGRRAAIEPVIGHLKSDYRMARCFLKGAEGAGLNLELAAAAWNLKKWLNEFLFVLILWLKQKDAQSDSSHQIKIRSSLRAA